MQTLDRLRQDAAEKALLELKLTVIPNLERVIEGTPTGPLRESLTTANILLQLAADGKTIDNQDVLAEALKHTTR